MVLGKVLSGDRFTDANGVEIRLAGIVAAGSDDGNALSIARSREALMEGLSAGGVGLAFAGSPSDRYGRRTAQVFVQGRWLQDALLQAGLARMAPDAATGLCARRLLDAEAEGREHHAGLWGDGLFVIRDADAMVRNRTRDVNHFVIAEDRVTSASVIGGRAYLNFGTDRKIDFTVTIAPEQTRNFRGRRRIESYAGKRIRVRGWVESFQGPEMEIAQAEALEDLEAPMPAAKIGAVKKPKTKTPKASAKPKKPRVPRKTKAKKEPKAGL